MATEQQRAYDDADKIHSDPWGVFDRDNRNHRKKRRLITDACAASVGERVLEVGCGHGIHLADFADEYDMTAVDLSPSLCREAQRRAPDANVTVADARRLPIADDAFAAVVGAAVLHHLPDAKAALREWLRVARQSVTLMEPNVLFPKDLVTAHTVPEERHKTQMRPDRVRAVLADLPGTGTVEPQIVTPPWPAAFVQLYDRVDDLVTAVPGLRWSAQMLRIHIDVSG